MLLKNMIPLPLTTCPYCGRPLPCEACRDFDCIAPGLYVGSDVGARQFRKVHPSGAVICVLEGGICEQRRDELHYPILRYGAGPGPVASPEALDRIAAIIERTRNDGGQAMVHCSAGVERSPLACAWYLRTSLSVSLKKAYALVFEARPQAEDRSRWLPRGALRR